MKLKLLLGIITCFSLATAQEPTTTYVGTKMCKMCHNKAKTGQQYTVWLESSHARALATLATDAAKQIAVDRGIKTAPDKSPECLQCHVTGWGDPSGYQLTVDPNDRRAMAKNAALENVGCEACHGAGSEYKGKKVMEAITAGTIDPATVGLVLPDEATCKKCHNENSPTDKEFVFEEAVKLIAHPYPEKAQ
ncbi:MAG: cytochrome c family protein [Candidatus Marinimicrobia bacterium]|nr:cytochrome c family protein [Candidatus Neomarinimicrobiota bacterium]MCF7840176.1 cytochrome c family protein [Candidatus Neomarinimicrobiota bacterium]MCF7902631.1 cytochrome c family protein [Candidatus Neomarinimicrobiota bacterium]